MPSPSPATSNQAESYSGLVNQLAVSACKSAGGPAISLLASSPKRLRPTGNVRQPFDFVRWSMCGSLETYHSVESIVPLARPDAGP